ncbi:sensor histidine kinase [Actinomadura sp. 6N118]|uniref:sensor histidine kinase n=1 Tax=Actinomadura sp. 6N118 TaxID=3375151 RepID=UPI0037AB8A4C
MRTDGGVQRWPSVADFAVPAITAAFQLGVTYLIALEEPLDKRQWMVFNVAVACSCVALIWRRVAPVQVLAVVVLINGIGQLAVGTGDTLVDGVTDAIALYSLAVHRGPRHAMIGGFAACAVVSLASAPHLNGGTDLWLDTLANVLFYVAITALGQIRRQRKARRLELTARLAEAEQERRAAAEAERERLARDLHDVAGHHLSAVVVHSGAAARLDDPELTTGALTVAAETGRDVLKSLSKLVDVVGPEAGDGELKSLLPPLCHGLTRLGIPVSLTVEGRPRKLPPEVTTAAYRIVQESLTNAMRYASGAPVRVEARYTSAALEVTVANDPPGEDGAVPVLGTNRGITGMRERAAGLGGTLDAGPCPKGGWSVDAILPTTPAGPRRGLDWPEVLDATAIAFCVGAPAILAFALQEESIVQGWSVGAMMLITVALFGRALPLWWRRRNPYGTLIALVVVDSIWAAVAARLSEPLLGVLAVGFPAELIAVYSVACYARKGRPTWPAVLIGPIPWAVAIGAALAVDPEPDEPGAAVFALMFGLVAGGMFSALTLLPFWAWGKAVAARSRGWEINALETMAARTGEAVLAERHRIAMGLRGTVFDHTSRLVRAAEAGLAGTAADAQAALEVVTEQARAALVDMRELLDAMEEQT